MIVVWLFLAVPWVCLQSVIVVFPDHTHLLFFSQLKLPSFKVMVINLLESFAILPSSDKKRLTSICDEEYAVLTLKGLYAFLKPKNKKK